MVPDSEIYVDTCCSKNVQPPLPLNGTPKKRKANYLGDYEEVLPSFKHLYRLHCIISHKGYSASVGHYVAYINHRETSWKLFDDSMVTDVTEKTVFEIEREKDGYIFFYIYSEL